MATLFVKVAGLGVHLKSILCAARCRQGSGKLLTEARSFGAMTGGLRAVADYLQALGVTHAAREATGVLWRPVWGILEGRLTLLLVNPGHLTKVPGRKSDGSDAEWIARLSQHGLLRGGFVAPRAVRQLRDLTRQRGQLVAEHTRAANRIHKPLEDCNIELGCVAPDALGTSGRALLRALLAGEQDARKLAGLALGRLREKAPRLVKALEGHRTRR